MTPTAAYAPADAAALLALLPPYTEIRVEWRGRLLDGLARDAWRAPGEGARRFTVGGSEWFIDAESLERLGSVVFEVEGVFRVEVVGG